MGGPSVNAEESLRRESEALARTVGHPGELFELLQEAIQHHGYTRFSQISDDWLRLMWAIDSYRIQGIPPHGMGNPRIGPARRLGAIYRSKGNWFATLVALLLQNQTTEVVKPRVRIEGFSQLHQVDLAWPGRHEDPLFCIETKVTGAPAYGDVPARGPLSDWSNRRKELKFAATDLKLFRRQQETRIEHWDVWRGAAPPRTYFLWGARIDGDGPDLADMTKMCSEARALVQSYLEGAGLVAWRQRSDGAGYATVATPREERVSSLDDVLYKIASEIRASLIGGVAPAPVVPAIRAVDLGQLLEEPEREPDA